MPLMLMNQEWLQQVPHRGTLGDTHDTLEKKLPKIPGLPGHVLT